MNDGQSTGPAGVDINVVPAWNNNVTGRGVVISILDDGVDHSHPDLRDNFVSLDLTFTRSGGGGGRIVF
jgi:subtilisin family serine protease